MAHRFNTKTMRKEPKPSASERTLYRWRERHGLETEPDIQRRTTFEEIKKQIQDNIISKLRRKKQET